MFFYFLNGFRNDPSLLLDLFIKLSETITVDAKKIFFTHFYYLLNICYKYEYDIINEEIVSDSIINPPVVIDPLTPDPPSRVVVLCENGFANEYPCSGMDFYSQITLTELGSDFANDNWGWTDRETGKEYVIQGLNDGTAFIDISDPLNPIYLAKISVSTPSTWRDIKVFKNHAFIVSEANDHGLQIFDLTRLREINTFQSLIPDKRLNTFGNAHNIAINESTGYAYVIGTQRYSGGPLFIDINDPKNPIEAGGYRNMGYSHDAQVINYTGPIQTIQEKKFILEVMKASNEDKVVIVDVTDKTNPTQIATIDYPSLPCRT